MNTSESVAPYSIPTNVLKLCLMLSPVKASSQAN